MYGTATVKIVRAELARDKRMVTEMDPYCVLKTNAGELKTNVAKNMGRNPAWNETFTVNLNGDGFLYIGVWDHKTLGRDGLVGEATLTLNPAMAATPFSSWVPLLFQGTNAGQLFLEIIFTGLAMTPQVMAAPGLTAPIGGPLGQPVTVVNTPVLSTSGQTAPVVTVPVGGAPVFGATTVMTNQAVSGVATVRIVRAELTHNKALLGSMDPYCILRTNAAEVQTAVATKQGRTPTWNNAFNINLSGDQVFHIAVWDKNLLKDGLVGETTINLGSVLGNSTTPGRSAGWHPLYLKGETAGQVYLEIDAANFNSQPVFVQSGTVAGQGTTGGLLNRIMHPLH